MKKRLSSVILVVLLVLSSVTVFGAPQPRWKEVNTYVYYMENTNAWFSNAKVGTTVDCLNSKSKITLTVTVQQRTSSGWSNTGFTWTSTDNAGTSINKDIKLSAGNYRSESVAVIYSSTGAYVETVTKYSGDIVI